MPRKGQNKTFASKRTMNPPVAFGESSKGPGTAHSSRSAVGRAKANTVAAFQQQDAKRRLGGFTTAGEHSRNTVRGTAKNRRGMKKDN
jgi:hypothetical protein